MFRRCPGPCTGPGIDRLGDALVHILNDPDRGVRFAAMEALGDMRWERGVAALAGLFDYYQRGDDATAAIAALARVGHPSSLATFHAAVGRKEEGIRLAATEGLARVGTKEALREIETTLVAEKSAAVRLARAFARARAGQAAELGTVVQAIGDRFTRRQAQDYLVEIGRPAAPAAAAALASADPDTRVALIEVAATIGGPGDVAAVEPFTKDRSATVAATAERAVRRLTSAAK